MCQDREQQCQDTEQWNYNFYGFTNLLISFVVVWICMYVPRDDMENAVYLDTIYCLLRFYWETEATPNLQVSIFTFIIAHIAQCINLNNGNHSRASASS